MNAKFYYKPRFKNQFHEKTPDSILKSFLEFYPEAKPADIDFEEFVECAIQLSEAKRLGFNVFAINDIGEVLEPGVVLGNALGRIRTTNPNLIRPNDSRSGSLASSYYQRDFFKNNAGREIVLCGLNEDSDSISPHLFDVIIQKQKDGVEQLVVKTTEVKSGLFVVDLTQVDFNNRTDVADFLGMDFFEQYMHKLDADNVFIVQPMITMKKEYRMVVVNNELACGAGQVPQFTPLDNESVFDPKVIISRYDADNVERLFANELDAMKVFAQSVIEQQKKELPGLKDYTLDIFSNENGFGIVEINPLDNFGFFALDVESYLLALNTVVEKLEG